MVDKKNTDLGDGQSAYLDMPDSNLAARHGRRQGRHCEDSVRWKRVWCDQLFQWRLVDMFQPDESSRERAANTHAADWSGCASTGRTLSRSEIERQIVITHRTRAAAKRSIVQEKCRV